jgi:hypothetical protein
MECCRRGIGNIGFQYQCFKDNDSARPLVNKYERVMVYFF